MHSVKKQKGNLPFCCSTAAITSDFFGDARKKKKKKTFQHIHVPLAGDQT
jgi:hypothetical protein